MFSKAAKIKLCSVHGVLFCLSSLFSSVLSSIAFVFVFAFSFLYLGVVEKNEKLFYRISHWSVWRGCPSWQYCRESLYIMMKVLLSTSTRFLWMCMASTTVPAMKPCVWRSWESSRGVCHSRRTSDSTCTR